MIAMPSARPRAFTLIELLAVITVISVLIAFVAPALGANAAKNLTAGGNLVTDLASQAREEAIARSGMVALVLLNGSGRPDRDNRSFILVELTPGAANWTPVTAWVSLPTGVTVDATRSAAFTDSAYRPSAGSVPIKLPPCSGTAVTDSQCAYQIFLPNGGLASNSTNPSAPPMLRFVPAAAGAGAHDYYDLILNRFTGIPKADRP